MKFGIRHQILISFMIPVIFIILVGVIAYRKAESGMREKYVSSTGETVKMTAEHVDLVSSFVKAEAMRYAFDQEFLRLCDGIYDDDPFTKNNVIATINSNIVSSQAGNSFLRHIHVITKDGSRMFSTKMNNLFGFYESYVESMPLSPETGKVYNWIDAHPLLDEKLKLEESKDSFLFSYQVTAQSKNAMVVMDVSQDAMQSFLDGIHLGDGSLLGLVTMNGREITNASGKAEKWETSISFPETDFYGNVRDKIRAGELTGVEEIRYQKEKCLLFYASCEVSGCLVYAIVPLSTVTAEAFAIRLITTVAVVVALFIALSVGFWITLRIQRNVRALSDGLGEVARGDLTVRVEASGRDEFSDLADATTEMIYNTKSLVAKVEDATMGLAKSSEDVQEAAALLSVQSGSIAAAITEMADGMERQKGHAEECVDLTDRLSDEIRNISRQIGSAREVMARAQDMIREGFTVLESLGEKARDTAEASGSVKQSVDALLAETLKINSFVDVIRSISSQTNLLSLNASIEAARAGEAGRGFAVVAEEIRKLAAESSDAAGEIGKMVETINGQTKISKGSIDKAGVIVTQQMELMQQSVGIFERMQESIAALTREMETITSSADEAEERRKEAVTAVRSISDIISDSSENAEMVKGVLASLQGQMENLDETARKLGKSMDELKMEVSAFKI